MRRRRWMCVLALGAWALAALAARPARADGSDEPPGQTDRVKKIGPQAVVIISALGDVRMYDDPSQHPPECRSLITCWGPWVGIAAGIAISGRAAIATTVAGGGAPTVVGAPATVGASE